MISDGCDWTDFCLIKSVFHAKMHLSLSRNISSFIEHFSFQNIELDSKYKAIRSFSNQNNYLFLCNFFSIKEIFEWLNDIFWLVQLINFTKNFGWLNIKETIGFETTKIFGYVPANKNLLLSQSNLSETIEIWFYCNQIFCCYNRSIFCKYI